MRSDEFFKRNEGLVLKQKFWSKDDTQAPAEKEVSSYNSTQSGEGEQVLESSWPRYDFPLAP